MGSCLSLYWGITMHWASVCYILLVSSVFQEVFSTDSPEGSGASLFSDDEDFYEEPTEAGEGSGDSWSDDEDCEKSGCRKKSTRTEPVMQLILDRDEYDYDEYDANDSFTKRGSAGLITLGLVFVVLGAAIVGIIMGAKHYRTKRNATQADTNMEES